MSPTHEPLPIEAVLEPGGRQKVSIVRIIVVCLAAAIVPGGGHFILGRWGRGLVLAASVLGMFACGLFWMQGHLFSPNSDDLVSIFPFIANLGMGGVYLLCYKVQFGFEATAEAPTYEFGNTFLLVAGLMNFLVILDAYDLAVGRRK